MSSQYSLIGVQKLGFRFFADNFKEIFKYFAMPLFVTLLGLNLACMPIYNIVQANRTPGSADPHPVSTILYLFFGAVLTIYGTWKALLACLYIIYAVKNETKTQSFSVFDEIVKSRKKDFIKSLGQLAKYYFYWLAPFLVAMFFMFFAFAINKPSIYYVTLGATALVYQILNLFLIWFVIKTFLILQIFVCEENLEPKNIIKRCFEVVHKKGFTFTFVLVLIFAFLSLLPFLFMSQITLGLEAGLIISFSITLLVNFIIIPIYLVAGYYTYKRFTN